MKYRVTPIRPTCMSFSMLPLAVMVSSSNDLDLPLPESELEDVPLSDVNVSDPCSTSELESVLVNRPRVEKCSVPKSVWRYSPLMLHLEESFCSKPHQTSGRQSHSLRVFPSPKSYGSSSTSK